MEINNKDYKRYKRMAVVICSGDEDEASDLLQDTLINFLEKDTAQDKLTDSFIFISLKNRFLNSRRNIKHSIEYEDFRTIEIAESDEELEIRKDKENEDQRKLDLIQKNISKLHPFEQQLFSLIVIKEIPQITISNGTGIKPSTLNNRYKIIKDKLKQDDKRI